jgi:hypothetical protein
LFLIETWDAGFGTEAEEAHEIFAWLMDDSPIATVRGELGHITDVIDRPGPWVPPGSNGLGVRRG